MRCLPRAPAAGTCDRAGAGQRQSDRVGLLLARGEDPDLAGRLDRRQRQRQPGRRRLGRARAPPRPAARRQRRQAGEQRRDVPLRADAEHQHVERGYRSRGPPAGPPRGQLGRVPGGGRLRVVPVGAVRARHRVHPAPGRRRRGRAGPRARRSRCGPGRPAGTNRSSPHQMSRCCQSTASRAGAAASSSSTAVPMPPPVSTSFAPPRAAGTRRPAAVTRRAATAWASSVAVPVDDHLGQAQRPGCDVPALEATKLAGRAASRRRPRRGRAGAVPRPAARRSSRRCSATRRSGRPGQDSVALRPSGRVSATLPSAVSKVTSVMPGPAGLAALDLDAQPQPEPGRDQVRARVTRLGQDLAAEQLGVGLVQRGREQRPPRRRPGPAEVGVARLVGLGQLPAACPWASSLAAASVTRRWASAPSASAAGRGRRHVRPPDDHRHVGREQRRHHRVGVLAERAVHAQQDGLAGAGLARRGSRRRAATRPWACG